MIVLIMLALILSTIMSWHSLAGGYLTGCGSGSPCDQVLNSRWSMVAGMIPVSGLAVGVYLALLVAFFYTGPDTEAPVRRLAWSVLLILAGSVAGSALWFTILQKWVIGDFCPYCITIHATGLLLAALVIWRAIKEYENHSTRRNNPLLSSLGLALVGLILGGTLAASQLIFNSRQVYSGGESQDNLPVIDYHNVPVVGSPDAPYVITLLFDYQCSHCQKLHFMLNEAILRYDDNLAFALCLVPLNTDCNPYVPGNSHAFRNSCELARIGLAVWMAKHEAFPAFDNWMFTYESGDRWHPRSLEAARGKAIELVGQAKFDSALTDPWIGQYLKTSTQIYGQTIKTGTSGIPKMIYNSRWVIPEPDNANDLVMILQKTLEVPLP
jgi:uncharacterized membrane protein/protein-disulfide isomerase